MLVNAITNERELLSYSSFVIDVEQENGSGQKPDEKEEAKGLKWYWILLIILAVLILIIIILLVVRCFLKNRKNEVEDEGPMVPLTTENKI